MRILVFFDLPVLTSEQRRNYRAFRRFLIKNGYMMLQESVYCKLALNATAVKGFNDTLKTHKPKEGIVQILTVTERQFSSMEIVTGTFTSSLIDSDERLLIL